MFIPKETSKWSMWEKVSDKKELLNNKAINAAIKRSIPLEDSNFKKSLITLRKTIEISYIFFQK